MQLQDDWSRRMSYVCRPFKHHILGPHCQWELTADYQLRMVTDMVDCIEGMAVRFGGATSESIREAAMRHSIRLAHSQAAGSGEACYSE